MLVMNATEAEIHEKLAVTESKIVITVDLALEKIVQAAKRTTVKYIIGVSLAESMPCVIGTLYKWKSKIKQENCVLFSEFLKAGQGKKIDCQEIKADAPAIIAYTGGTTGKAKGVLLSNRAANTMAFQYKYADKVMDFQNGERFLDIIPPFLVYGLVFLGGYIWHYVHALRMFFAQIWHQNDCRNFLQNIDQIIQVEFVTYGSNDKR